MTPRYQLLSQESIEVQGKFPNLVYATKEDPTKKEPNINQGSGETSRSPPGFLEKKSWNELMNV